MVVGGFQDHIYLCHHLDQKFSGQCFETLKRSKELKLGIWAFTPEVFAGFKTATDLCTNSWVLGVMKVTFAFTFY